VSTLAEVQKELHDKQERLGGLFAKGYVNFTEEEVKQAREWNDELAALGKKRDELSALDQMEKQIKAAKEADEVAVRNNRLSMQIEHNERQTQTKSLHQFLSESKDYESVRNGNLKEARIMISDEAFESKTLITSSDFTIVADRRPGIIDSVQPRILVSDMMMQGTATGPSFTYLEETTFTNNAAETSEGGTKPESALDWTERTENIRKIATWIPVTQETIEDVARAQQQITGRLRYMVERRRESQLIVGDGIAPNLLGLLNRTGIQTQAKGTDPTPDAFYKAMVKIMVNADADPDGIVVHPNDWQDIRLLRTSDGVYIWGSPAEAGPERLWGLTVRKTTGITENTGLVGAFRPYTEFVRRKGIEVIISTEHSTYAVENKIAIIAEERVGLAVYRGAALCKVTGI
jgi:HK97 family phage major capsid protein